jgi:hypothetical protein
MAPAERSERLALLRRGVEQQDIGWWLRRQMEDLVRIEARRGGRSSPITLPRPGRSAAR